MSANDRTRRKWEAALDGDGFQIIPNLLIAQQGNLGLSTTDIVVILHLNRWWWERDQHPYPRPERIAEQMGLHARSVERCLKRLERKGMIRRMSPRYLQGGTSVRPISLLPLAESLAQIAGRLNTKRRPAQKIQTGRDPAGQSSASPQDVTSSNEVTS